MGKQMARLEIKSFPGWAKREGWKGLLNAWAGILGRYEGNGKERPKDVAYWYGERALVGHLAAAAWLRRGGWALVEFLGRDATATRIGDLWLGTGSAESTVEAKCVWGGTSIQRAVRAVEEALGRAGRQLRSYAPEYRVGEPVAICFVIPELGRPFDERRYFDEFAGQLMTKTRLLATFHDSAFYEKRYYGGVMLVADRIEWRKGKM